MLSKCSAHGVELAVLPENFAYLGEHVAIDSPVAQRTASGELTEKLAEWAKRFKLVLVGGTLPVPSPEHGKVYSRSHVLGSDGGLLGHYDKVHLFDVVLPGKDERYCESDHYMAGDQALVVDTEVGKLGVAVCYDLRFPELFRQISAQDAHLCCLPSAFTHATGSAHWSALVRARAIENQCCFVAANQVGNHGNQRETYGHSLIVDAWGTIKADAGCATGLIVSEWDGDWQQDVRSSFPVLQHRKLD